MVMYSENVYLPSYTGKSVGADSASRGSMCLHLAGCVGQSRCSESACCPGIRVLVQGHTVYRQVGTAAPSLLSGKAGHRCQKSRVRLVHSPRLVCSRVYAFRKVSDLDTHCK